MRLSLYMTPLRTKSSLLEEREIKLSSLCHRYFGLDSNLILPNMNVLPKVTQLVSGRAGIQILICLMREGTSASSQCYTNPRIRSFTLQH